MSVTIIDTGMGNIFSIIKVFNRLNVEIVVSENPKVIRYAEKIILPGVGHFKQAMKRLNENYLIDTLNELAFIKKTPILGICLGLQIMAQKSEEGNEMGLGWFDSDVVRFIPTISNQKVPHMGWNNITGEFTKSKLLRGITHEDEFYFVHSYHWRSKSNIEVAASTEYIYSFPSVIEMNNLYGVQFHPEKSFVSGEKILMNFIHL